MTIIACQWSSSLLRAPHVGTTQDRMWMTSEKRTLLSLLRQRTKKEWPKYPQCWGAKTKSDREGKAGNTRQQTLLQLWRLPPDVAGQGHIRDTIRPLAPHSLALFNWLSVTNFHTQRTLLCDVFFPESEWTLLADCRAESSAHAFLLRSKTVLGSAEPFWMHVLYVGLQSVYLSHSC